jgi:serine/threonine-protein kinase
MLWIVGDVSYRLAAWVKHGPDAAWAHLDTPDLVAGVSVLASLALFFYLRRERDPRFVVDLGLGHMVALALAIGVAMHWGPASGEWRKVSPVITWIGPVILMFSGIVPIPPRKMAIAGFLAASMDPVGMLICRAYGHYTFDSLSDVLVMHYPNYIIAGIAVVISGVMTGLSRQVTRAREMGSYQLGELLGRGGMGEVYQATHRMLARPAAIKLIRPEMIMAGNSEAADLAVRRFRREAEVAANLRSPHTVELYDFGVTEDQTLYFVMELLDGLDLESFTRQHGPIPAARVVFLLRQVCESLEEAHQRGLVHRDIKPANIHVGRLGLQSDFVKVLDFGLVKSVMRSETEQSVATAAGIYPGTPAYMAPEMALGETVDRRADIYALGCVAYFLLTGQLVFDGESPVQVIVKHVQNDPIPPSQRTELPIPPALDAVVLQCLAKKPDQRPQTARELSARLSKVQVSDPWTDEEAERWWAVNLPAP